jgi:hypothetical protein
MMFKNFKTTLLCFWLVVLGIALGLHSQGVRRDTPATIAFHIVDSYGKPVSYKVESFHELGKSKLELAGKFQGLTFKGAVQGQMYEVRLAPLKDPQKFPSFTRYIPVGQQAYIFLVFAVRESSGFEDDRLTPHPATRFVIKPAPSGDLPAWVTVSPAFAPEVPERGIESVPLEPSGTFTLHGTHGGTYIVSLCQGTKVTKTTVVDIPLIGPEELLEITLK